jgi:hypothetical protein
MKRDTRSLTDRAWIAAGLLGALLLCWHTLLLVLATWRAPLALGGLLRAALLFALPSYFLPRISDALQAQLI